MHAITPCLFSKDVYSVPLRLWALRLRGCVRLDRGGGRGGYWLPKCFQMYKKFSGHIIIFSKIQLFSKFTFSCPENYLNSPENLLQIYLSLPKSALEIYLKFLMSNYQGCCTTPPPPSEFQANTLWFIVHVFHPLSYTILLEDLLSIKKCRQKHGGSDAIAMTTGP
jgi:hypothetical protein